MRLLKYILPALFFITLDAKATYVINDSSTDSIKIAYAHCVDKKCANEIISDLVLPNKMLDIVVPHGTMITIYKVYVYPLQSDPYIKNYPVMSYPFTDCRTNWITSLIIKSYPDYKEVTCMNG